MMTSIRIASYGVLLLCLGMGFGRFIYTPIIPILINQDIFTFSQASTIATANYAGYLAGSVLCSFSRVPKITATTSVFNLILLCCALLVLSMVYTENFYLFTVIRFIAGVLSAAIIISATVRISALTARKLLLASLYSGVGLGIAFGNELVNYLTPRIATASQLISIVGFVTLAICVLIFILDPSRVKLARLVSQTKDTQQPAMSASYDSIPWYMLVIIYGLAGFGYIITATFLPYMLEQSNFEYISHHMWTIVGLAAIPSCFLWMYLAHRIGNALALILNLVCQGLCIIGTTYNDSMPVILLSSMVFGGTFMGTTTIVMTMARTIPCPKAIHLVGLVTLTYATGQMIGPEVARIAQELTNSLNYAIMIASSTLLIAALITALCGFRQTDRTQH